jgi:hypothetical protein
MRDLSSFPLLTATTIEERTADNPLYIGELIEFYGFDKASEVFIYQNVEPDEDDAGLMFCVDGKWIYISDVSGDCGGKEPSDSLESLYAEVSKAMAEWNAKYGIGSPNARAAHPEDYTDEPPTAKFLPE